MLGAFRQPERDRFVTVGADSIPTDRPDLLLEMLGR